MEHPYYQLAGFAARHWKANAAADLALFMVVSSRVAHGGRGLDAPPLGALCGVCRTAVIGNPDSWYITRPICRSLGHYQDCLPKGKEALTCGSIIDREPVCRRSDPFGKLEAPFGRSFLAVLVSLKE